MTFVSAPYRFIPVSPVVARPDWADQVSHDVPFADGLSGELALGITTHTPLCIGGEQTRGSDTAPGQVKFFRDPVTDNPAIPGTSLKGMLRNVMEIATFAHFEQVDERKLSVRDITESKNNFYFKAAPPDSVRAGWLHFVDGAWRIRPCAFSRLHQAELIKALGTDENRWKQCRTAPKRYDLIGAKRQIRFNRSQMANNNQGLAQPSDGGEYHGTVVVTGQPGGAFDTGKAAKKYEFVFHHSDTSPAPLAISTTVMSGFFRIHEDGDEWKYWRQNLSDGVPVFFHANGSKVASLGLAMMYKVPYKNSVHDAIRHTSEEHLNDNTTPDLPQLIFGRLDETPGGSLRGRVNIGRATTDSIACEWTRNTVLNAPKPTFYPAYIRQSQDTKTYNQLMNANAELAGWKRYPPKRDHILPPSDKSQPRVQIKLETAPANTLFTCMLRFHNLRPAELGAVLWCLDFGGRDALRHGLGLGKPYGLGQISLQIDKDGSRIQPNKPAQHDVATGDMLEAARDCFIQLMDKSLTDAGAGTTWEESGPIEALLASATVNEENRNLRYLDLNDFRELKKSENVDEVAATFHAARPLRLEVEALPLRASDCDVQTILAELPEKRRRTEAAAQRQQARSEASEEERWLMDLEELLVTAPPDEMNKSQKDNTNAWLRSLKDRTEQLDEEQLQRLSALLAPAEELNANKITKAVKQIQKKLND